MGVSRLGRDSSQRLHGTNALMHEEGLEPSRPLLTDLRILSPLRLPISPLVR